MVNSHSHREFLVKEIQVQVDQANRIEKQLIKALQENNKTAMCIPAVLCIEGDRIIAVGIAEDKELKCNKLQFQLNDIENEWIDADNCACDDFNWVVLMYNVLETLEPGIMD